MRLSAAARAPLVVLTNGRAALYNRGLGAWLRVVDGEAQLSLHATLMAAPDGAGAGDLERLLSDAAAAHAPASGGAGAGAGASRPAPAETCAHLESLMASALALGQPAAYERWLMAYVEFLAAYPEEQPRLDDVVSELLGPLRWTPRAAARGASPWPHLVLGVPKRRLLRGALARLARVPQLARYVRDARASLDDAEAFAERDEAAAAAAAAGGRRGGGHGGDGGEGGGAGGSGDGAAGGRGGRGVPGFDLGADPYGDDDDDGAGGSGGDGGGAAGGAEDRSGGTGGGGSGGGQEQRAPAGSSGARGRANGGKAASRRGARAAGGDSLPAARSPLAAAQQVQ